MKTPFFNLPTIFFLFSLLFLLTPLVAEEIDTPNTPNTFLTPDKKTLSMANPWRDFSTLEEAVAAAGFSIKLPQKRILGFTRISYRVLSLSSPVMIEIIYYNVDNEIARFRKAPIMNDTRAISESSRGISGDYNTYDLIKKIHSRRREITLKGDSQRQKTPGAKQKDKTRYSLAIWEAGGYSYSVTSDFFNVCDLLDLK